MILIFIWAQVILNNKYILTGCKGWDKKETYRFQHIVTQVTVKPHEPLQLCIYLQEAWFLSPLS